MWICKWNVNFEQSNNLLMALGLFLCLNQVMLTSLSRHQGLVLDHCKNEYRHRYTKTKSIQVPRSLHLKWVRGEEFSWSSWRCWSVATDRSSHPVGLSEGEERNGLLLYGAYMSLTSKGFITTSPLSPHLTTFYTFYPSSFYSSPSMEIKSQVPFRVVGAKKWGKQTPPRPKSAHSETTASIRGNFEPILTIFQSLFSHFSKESFLPRFALW